MRKFNILLACLLSCVTTLHAQLRPNILVIFSDDHAYQATGIYGNRLVATPNIDRIGREGAVFRNNFVTNSICGPSRATLLTGQYSHINGYKLNERKFDFNQAIFTDQLQQSGYQTAWIGKMHLGNLPTHGFDYFNIIPGQGDYYNPDFINKQHDTVRYTGYITDLITQFSVDWLNKRDASKPFFLVVGEKATHREWLPSLHDLGAYDSINFPLPANFYDNYDNRTAAADQDMTIDKTMRLEEDLKVHADYIKSGIYNRFTPEQRKVFEAYYDKISRDFDDKKLTGKALVEWKYQRYLKDYYAVAKSLDRNIGNILHYLDSTGLAKNTVVIYASDQGFYLGEHGWFDKRFMYEESLRSIFVMRYPGVIKPGTEVRQFVSNIDWAPTILDIAGVKPSPSMQGISFLKLADGKLQHIPWRNQLYYHYYEFPQPHHVHPHIGIRTERYKLIRFYGEVNSWELYDLQKDPHEQHNVYADKTNEQTIKKLKEQLKNLAVEYKDTEALPIIDTQ